MKGKYAYMAPEQTEGDNIDHRSDIFAVGIVLHEVLTGRRLFKGQNDVQTIERVRRCEVPPPSLQNPAVPPELDAHRAARRCSAIRRGAGSNAADMADALDDVVHAARFQPTHLPQILYDLFPTEGGAPRRARGSQRIRVARLDRSGGGRHRARTVPPISRTVIGRAPRCRSRRPSRRRSASLKPKSKFPSALRDAGSCSRAAAFARLEVSSARGRSTTVPRCTSVERSGAAVPRLREVDPRRRGHLPGRRQAADRRDAGDAADRSDGRRVGEAHAQEGRLRRLRTDSSSTTRRCRSA